MTIPPTVAGMGLSLIQFPILVNTPSFADVFSGARLTSWCAGVSVLSVGWPSPALVGSLPFAEGLVAGVSVFAPPSLSAWDGFGASAFEAGLAAGLFDNEAFALAFDPPGELVVELFELLSGLLLSVALVAGSSDALSGPVLFEAAESLELPPFRKEPMLFKSPAMAPSAAVAAAIAAAVAGSPKLPSPSTPLSSE